MSSKYRRRYDKLHDTGELAGSLNLIELGNYHKQATGNSPKRKRAGRQAREDRIARANARMVFHA